ncbi:MAG: amidoligase family protein [Thermovenabulum sp.]|uniref:amidoligase family protein n=1 Tax=Thermovenabulum sp. TaxID=3100335 RepID=UPI003C7C903F
MKDQFFGVEIELTGISRKQAAEVIAEYFGQQVTHEGGTYDKYIVLDNKWRKWQVVRDSSIDARFSNGAMAPDTYKVEIVTPVCEYSDIETIQEIVRKLREAGAIANSSCGIHIHVDASKHNEKTLKNIVNIIYSKEDLIYKALGVPKTREEKYCRKVETYLIEVLNSHKIKDMQEFEKVWYKGENGRNIHYHPSRYHGLNLHSVFYRGTVEFRFFNGTTHAGKIKAYIQFCLAISHQALTQKCAKPKRTVTDNEKYTFRTWLLRLGLIGDEFKTARTHLLANLKGNSAWRYAAA